VGFDDGVLGIRIKQSNLKTDLSIDTTDEGLA
jgi:hypothetical protein